VGSPSLPIPGETILGTPFLWLYVPSLRRASLDVEQLLISSRLSLLSSGHAFHPFLRLTSDSTGLRSPSSYPTLPYTSSFVLSELLNLDARSSNLPRSSFHPLLDLQLSGFPISPTTTSSLLFPASLPNLSPSTFPPDILPNPLPYVLLHLLFILISASTTPTLAAKL